MCANKLHTFCGMQCVFAIMACSKHIATASEAPEAHGNEDIPSGSATICFVTM